MKVMQAKHQYSRSVMPVMLVEVSFSLTAVQRPLTSVKLRSVSDGGGEDPDLAQEDGDQESGPGWVAGGGNQVGDPGGEGEHGGGDEVYEDVLAVP